MLVVSSGKLHVTLVRSASAENEVNWTEETVVTLTLIQLTEDNGYETGVTLEKRHVKAGDVGVKRTVDFDVASTVQTWLLASEENHGFQVAKLFFSLVTDAVDKNELWPAL